MSEFSKMMERIRLDDLIAYILYGTESEIKHTRTYEERILESYDKIFETLEKYFRLPTEKTKSYTVRC